MRIILKYKRNKKVVEYDADGKPLSVCYYWDDKLHHLTKPAMIIYHDNTYEKRWYLNNRLKRINGGPVIVVCQNKHCLRVTY